MTQNQAQDQHAKDGAGTHASSTEQAVQVGFEKALTMMNPEWRTGFTVDQVNQFRHFYHQGVQDMNILNQLAFQQSQQNFQAVINTIVVTGNEARIAEMQAQAAAANEAEAASAKPVKGGKKAAAKVVPIAAKGKTPKKGKR